MEKQPVDRMLPHDGLDSEALAILRGLKPMLEAHADEVAKSFYSRLIGYEEIRALIPDAETKRHFLAARRHYLLSLADTEFGEEYFEERRQAGRLQAMSGLSSGWASRLAALHASLLTPLILEHFQPDRAKAADAIRALAGRLTRDVDVALDSYMECREEGLAFMASELARERRRLEQDLQEQRVSLRKTTRRAEAAEELASIATLVAGLAHEIGTPMSVIQGHAKMLEKSMADEDEQWRLRTIQDQISRISHIIQTLLGIAHPRRASPEPVALVPLVEQTLSFVSEKLAMRRVVVATDLAEDVSVVGDRARLQQLLLNLVLNAADAMPDGGVLTITVAQIGETVLVRLEDTGIGIGTEELERIFEPFFTTKEAGQGNGLGLMVCKGIVSDHGGEIEVSSQPGRGARFAIRLPSASAAPAPIRSEAIPPK